MFSKVSRYRNVPQVTALDAEGRTLSATDIRLLPQVTGTFQHTVLGGDRLDQLANQFYSQPLQWWNICDGNPRFLSPQSMLGQDSVTAAQFPVTATGAPSWNALLAALGATPGVEDVRISEAWVLSPQPAIVSGQTITTYVEQATWSVTVRYNQLNITADALATAIENAGFKVGAFAELGPIGQGIVIPPKPTG
jgi:hypothetical protein